MKTLPEIKANLREGNVELTMHSLKRIVQRNISEREIGEMADSTVIIEDYPDDKYYPSYLLLGFTSRNRPLHLHVSRMPGECVRLITIYEPNSQEWVDNYSKRK
jgi:hypothetical protein